ncbi:MAG: DUF2628 domain-containing protein [Nitrospirota bacterium]|nr:DUF2628 domain-containing protein [Nitrospirota bacterium]MDE3241753.1 DUF2628 domain-containing protein [Nitrospirota bacterium]
MKPCQKCEQQNPDDARFCSQCGVLFEEETAPPGDMPAEQAAEPSTEPSVPPILDEQQLWRAFIGPNADRYLEQFRKFTGSGEPRFALTWHWPAFLFDPFLWFLYRKMYLYAAVYAIGPVLSAYFTGDLTVGVVWRIMAGASANYIYYWHVREHLAAIKEQGSQSGRAQEQSLKDLGGVQPYVVWVGVALHIIMLAVLIKAIQEGPTEGGKFPPLKPAAPRSRASLES